MHRFHRNSHCSLQRPTALCRRQPLTLHQPMKDANAMRKRGKDGGIWKGRWRAIRPGDKVAMSHSDVLIGKIYIVISIYIADTWQGGGEWHVEAHRKRNKGG